MRSIRIESAMESKIWNIVSKYRCGWISRHLGYMELFYETEEGKQLAEKELLSKGFVVIQGTANISPPNFYKKVHRVFSPM